MQSLNEGLDEPTSSFPGRRTNRTLPGTETGSNDIPTGTKQKIPRYVGVRLDFGECCRRDDWIGREISLNF